MYCQEHIILAMGTESHNHPLMIDYIDQKHKNQGSNFFATKHTAAEVQLYSNIPNLGYTLDFQFKL